MAVIDVYPSASARRADLFLCITPGSDVYLALGVARALLELGLLDRDFLRVHASGWQEFLSLAQQLTVPEAARECGIEADQLYELARLYGLRPASTWLGMGMQHYRWGMTAAAFAATPGALTGQLGVRGGGVSFFTASLTPFNLDWVAPHPLTPAAGGRPVRKAVLAADLAAGPPHRVAWFQGSNIVKQAPASWAVARALTRVRFKVALELRLRETASLCDLVLPAASFLEFENVRGSFGTPWVGHMAPVIPPPGECRPEPEIYAQIALRLGCEHQYLEGGGPEGWLRRSLAPLAGHGVTLDTLREQGVLSSQATVPTPNSPLRKARSPPPTGASTSRTAKTSGATSACGRSGTPI